ncbi:MAG: hypothetical protein GC200_06250 [Tepidisphaera sp.]|nr:hypothetical protein [Tepidisphaera sp.]
MNSTCSIVSLAACLVCGGVCAAGNVVTINFDVNPAGQAISAPAAFDNASPLHNTFAAWGVHFSGANSNQGGALLNDSTFSVRAFSGHNFLALSTVESTEFGGPETITFDVPMTQVSIEASGIGHPLAFQMQAFDASGVMVDSDTLTTAGWSQMTVASNAGIRSVTLRVLTSGVNTVTFDDLLAVPEMPPSCDADVNQDGVVDQGDVDYLVNVIAGGENPTGIDADFNGDGVADQGDVDAIIDVIAGGSCP